MSAFRGVQQLARERVEERIEQILARPQFDFANDEGPSLLQRFVEWFVETLGDLFDFDPGVDPSAAADVLWNVLLALAVLALVLLIARWVWLRWHAAAARRAAAEAPAADVRRRVAELRAEAARARAAGDLRLALRLLLFALVVGLGERGDLRYREAWTNRELLERGRPRPAVDALLRPLVVELEAKEFGNEPTVSADVERLETLCARWLDGAPGARKGAAA